MHAISRHSGTWKLTVGAVVVTALFMGSPGYADTTTGTPGSVNVATGEVVTPPTGLATKGVAVNANGNVINVPKVSDPVLRVKASSATTIPKLSTTAYAAPTASCSVADNPAAGQLNRSIEVTVAAGESGNVYSKLTFLTTDVATGVTTENKVEPFGAGGLNITSPPVAPTLIPITICVA